MSPHTPMCGVALPIDRQQNGKIGSFSWEQYSVSDSRDTETTEPFKLVGM